MEMYTSSGFSFAEVLVSMGLMASLTLALLTHQWHISQLFNQINARNQALTYLDNASERLIAGASFVPAVKPYQLRMTATGLQIKWIVKQETLMLERSVG